MPPRKRKAEAQPPTDDQQHGGEGPSKKARGKKHPPPPTNLDNPANNTRSKKRSAPLATGNGKQDLNKPSGNSRSKKRGHNLQQQQQPEETHPRKRAKTQKNASEAEVESVDEENDLITKWIYHGPGRPVVVAVKKAAAAEMRMERAGSSNSGEGKDDGGKDGNGAAKKSTRSQAGAPYTTSQPTQADPTVGNAATQPQSPHADEDPCADVKAENARIRKEYQLCQEQCDKLKAEAARQAQSENPQLLAEAQARLADVQTQRDALQTEVRRFKTAEAAIGRQNATAREALSEAQKVKEALNKAENEINKLRKQPNTSSEKEQKAGEWELSMQQTIDDLRKQNQRLETAKAQLGKDLNTARDSKMEFQNLLQARTKAMKAIEDNAKKSIQALEDRRKEDLEAAKINAREENAVENQKLRLEIDRLRSSEDDLDQLLKHVSKKDGEGIKKIRLNISEGKRMQEYESACLSRNSAHCLSWAALKADAKQKAQLKASPWDWDKQLFAGAVLQAIFSVTEAIKPGQNCMSSLYTAEHHDMLYAEKEHPVTDQGIGARCCRPGKTLYLPWLSIVGENKTDTKQVYANSQQIGHWYLNILEFPDADKPSPDSVKWTIYNSSRPFEQLQEMKYARAAAEKLGWTMAINVEPRQMQASQQTQGYECGIHCILNAWCHALGLDVNPEFESSEEFLTNARWVIQLAIQGSASSELIYRWLMCSGFAAPGSEIAPGRSFDETVDLWKVNLPIPLPANKDHADVVPVALRELYEEVLDDEQMQAVMAMSAMGSEQS